MELDQYLGLFIDESKEHLQKLNESLLKLEENPQDLEILNDIFRVAHTLKGMSRTMGFNNIGDLTHNMENVLDPLRNGTLKSSGKIIDILFECLDKLEGLVGQVVDGNYEDKSSKIYDLITRLQEVLGGVGEKQVKTPKKEEEATFNEYELTIIENAKSSDFRTTEIAVFLTNDCVLPGVRAYMTVKALENEGEIIKSIPETEALENGEFEKVFRLFFVTKTTNENIMKIINKISEIEDVQVTDFDANSLRKDSQDQDEPETISSNEVKTEVASSQAVSTKIMPQTIRVSSDRMDKLMNLVGELVIGKTRITQIASELKSLDLTSSIESMGNITTNIQEIVMKLRMVPIEQVFNRFPRLVRDLSKDLNKDINLVITGKDTEIDRVVIDEIGDPLVHLIRNSLDHGLENAEDRIHAGKLAKGTLELSAFNEGDNILIRVTDDGKGIDPSRIKEIALKKGVITKEVAANMSDKDAIELIFAPGFSTNTVATDVSGRGVGMDVVKSKVSLLGGNVSVSSVVGKGTSITISLPSTMAIVQALLIKVGEEIYATPLNYISEVIDINPSEIKKIQNKEVIVFRGNTLSLIRSHKLLEVPNYKCDPNKPLTVVIIKSQEKSLGVIVSELLGQQEIVIKPINKKLCSEDFISGATTLGNGNVALIINVNALFHI